MPLEHEWAAEALFRLADWTNCTGEAYFRGLVRGLADVLSVRWVYLSRAPPDNAQPSRRSWPDGPTGNPRRRSSHDLAGTPCAEVLTGITCFHATGSSGPVPSGSHAVDLGVDSYAGTPLRGGTDRRMACWSSCTTVRWTRRDTTPARFLSCRRPGSRRARTKPRRGAAEEKRGADSLPQRVHTGLVVAGHARWPARLPIATRSRVLRCHASSRCLATATWRT